MLVVFLKCNFHPVSSLLSLPDMMVMCKEYQCGLINQELTSLRNMYVYSVDLAFSKRNMNIERTKKVVVRYIYTYKLFELTKVCINPVFGDIIVII